MKTLNEKTAMTAKELESVAWRIMFDRAGETHDAFAARGTAMAVTGGLVIAALIWGTWLGVGLTAGCFFMAAAEPFYLLGCAWVEAYNHAVIADLRETLEGRE